MSRSFGPHRTKSLNTSAVDHETEVFGSLECGKSFWEVSFSLARRPSFDCLSVSRGWSQKGASRHPAVSGDLARRPVSVHWGAKGFARRQPSARLSAVLGLGDARQRTGCDTALSAHPDQTIALRCGRLCCAMAPVDHCSRLTGADASFALCFPRRWDPKEVSARGSVPRPYRSSAIPLW
jgi:hypothetical protein